MTLLYYKKEKAIVFRGENCVLTRRVLHATGKRDTGGVTRRSKEVAFFVFHPIMNRCFWSAVVTLRCLCYYIVHQIETRHDL